MVTRGGKREGSGRKPGSPNKIAASVRKAILAAFDEVGGKDYLVSLAKTDPRTFCTLLGKTLPVKIAGDEDSPLHVIVRTVDRPPDETREEWLARRAGEMGATAPRH